MWIHRQEAEAAYQEGQSRRFEETAHDASVDTSDETLERIVRRIAQAPQEKSGTTKKN